MTGRKKQQGLTLLGFVMVLAVVGVFAFVGLKLFRRFYISYVESVKSEHVKVTRNNGYNLNVKYEVRRPLIYNLDFVAKFDKTVDLTRAGADD